MQIKPVHPFPARMAPEVAMDELRRAPARAVVLDPMAGSGTVLRSAVALGHSCLGFDVDPLAVLMSSVWTRSVSTTSVMQVYERVMEEVSHTWPDVAVPWIDEDDETARFTEYWFGSAQRRCLRRLAIALKAISPSFSAETDVLRVAMSRIIITKDRGASLARDVSHSRPHRCWDEHDYDVFGGFERSVRQVCRILDAREASGDAVIREGDARRLTLVEEQSVDVVVTSPPYLNALDYMRGHRMSLVWFGYRLSGLRKIRGGSIGTERGLHDSCEATQFIAEAMTDLSALDPARRGMVRRYAHDSRLMMLEVARVLKPGGRAIFVVGNSCLKGTFIRNSEAISTAGDLAGLRVLNVDERSLPEQRRYLPFGASSSDMISRRMRTETVLTFER